MDRMQKILSQGNDYHQKNSTEFKSYDGVQTVISITENHLVEVNFTMERLMRIKLIEQQLGLV